MVVAWLLPDALILSLIDTSSKANRQDIATSHTQCPFMHPWSFSLPPRTARITISPFHVLSSSKSNSLVHDQGAEEAQWKTLLGNFILARPPFPLLFFPGPAHFVSQSCSRFWLYVSLLWFNCQHHVDFPKTHPSRSRCYTAEKTCPLVPSHDRLRPPFRTDRLVSRQAQPPFLLL